jgi:hypothetical protein
MDRIAIDREQVVQVDPDCLPPDAQFKGYEDVVVQEVVFPYDQNIRTRLPTGGYASLIPRAVACLLLLCHPYSTFIWTAKVERGRRWTGGSVSKVEMAIFTPLVQRHSD